LELTFGKEPRESRYLTQ